jgi:hypothetical protein
MNWRGLCCAQKGAATVAGCGIESGCRAVGGWSGVWPALGGSPLIR